MEKEFYTGVGSRKTPPDVLALMTKIARYLRDKGWTLRSGAAGGADSAFEEGARDAAEIYLPWPGFNGRGYLDHEDDPEQVPDLFLNPTRLALAEAPKYHPAWGSLTQGARKLHARNLHQVLGRELNSPSAFLLCWTPDGAERGEETSIITGGTGTAIRVASAHDVLVFNLKKGDSLPRLRDFLKSGEGR